MAGVAVSYVSGELVILDLLLNGSLRISFEVFSFLRAVDTTLVIVSIFTEDDTGPYSIVTLLPCGFGEEVERQELLAVNALLVLGGFTSAVSAFGLHDMGRVLSERLGLIFAVDIVLPLLV
jgi:hypothetical protein